MTCNDYHTWSFLTSLNEIISSDDMQGLPYLVCPDFPEWDYLKWWHARITIPGLSWLPWMRLSQVRMTCKDYHTWSVLTSLNEIISGENDMQGLPYLVCPDFPEWDYLRWEWHARITIPGLSWLPWMRLSQVRMTCKDYNTWSVLTSLNEIISGENDMQGLPYLVCPDFPEWDYLRWEWHARITIPGLSWLPWISLTSVRATNIDSARSGSTSSRMLTGKDRYSCLGRKRIVPDAGLKSVALSAHLTGLGRKLYEVPGRRVSYDTSTVPYLPCSRWTVIIVSKQHINKRLLMLKFMTFQGKTKFY